MGCRSMCGPRFSPGRGFGRKSRRGSRDLAGAFPASTVCTRGASRAVLSAAGPRTGPRRQPLGIEGSCATRAFTAPIFRFSPRGASRGYEPWPLEPMAAAATSRTSKPQNDGISIIRAGRGKTLANRDAFESRGWLDSTVEVSSCYSTAEVRLNRAEKLRPLLQKTRGDKTSTG